MEMEIEGEKKCSSTASESLREEEEMSLPGFRFHPTDEELVGFYLKRKVGKRPLSIELIKEVDIYKYDPWDLPKVSNVGDREWYFFCLRGRKYRNSIRPNRVTGSGFWKATGIDRPIHSSSGEKLNGCIGLKKSLVYYKGSAGKGSKTDWMMHEFRLPPPPADKNTPKNTQEAEVWTLCRIFKRTTSHRKFIPDWNDFSLITKQQIGTDSTSKTCSMDSDARNGRSYFAASHHVKQIEAKPFAHHFEEQYQMLAGDHFSSPAQSTVTTVGPGFHDLGDNGFYAKENWDELGAVVEFALQPTLVYGCRYS